MPDVTGTYRVFGKYIPRDAPYQAEAIITRKGELYRIQWFSGGRRWEGIGVLQNEVLAVAIFSQNGNDVICYHIEETKEGLTLTGRWAYQVDETLSVETLIRTDSVPLDLLEDDDDGHFVAGDA